MKIAYAYNRHPDDLAHLTPDRAYIDMPDTKRQERGAMMRAGSLREGDTVLVLSEADLGGARIKAAIAERGARIEVAQPNGSGKTPGAPRKFLPDAMQDREIRALWHNPGYTLRYVLDRAAEIMGKPVARHHLIYRYGNRHGGS